MISYLLHTPSPLSVILQSDIYKSGNGAPPDQPVSESYAAELLGPTHPLNVGGRVTAILIAALQVRETGDE